MFIVGILGIRNSVEAVAAAVVEREVAAGADDGFPQGPIHGERDESESEKEEKHMRRRWRSGLAKNETRRQARNVRLRRERETESREKEDFSGIGESIRRMMSVVWIRWELDGNDRGRWW